MKTFRLFLAALVMAVSLAAQQPSGGPPANPVTTAFRGRILRLHRDLGLAFDSIPADKFGYKPTPAQQTLGYIAQHLADDSYLFCNTFGEMKATRPEKDTATPDTVKAKWPKDSLVAKMKESFAFCANALNQLDDTKLGEQSSMTFAGNTRQVTRAAMALGHAMDMADHYSQVANYMRLNGLIPPTALPQPGRRGGGGGPAR
jgi:uncharacterized damage-inducible protein DinB